MADPNMSDFYGRVARIQKARTKGYGFEAPGTLGRSYYYKPSVKRRAFVGPILLLAVCGFLMKGTMLHQIGELTYDSRVAALMQGKGIDYVGGWLMQSDPVTKYVSAKIDEAVRKFK